MPSCVLSLSLSLSFRHQHKRRPTKETRRALNKKRQNDEGLASSFSLCVMFAAFPKAKKKKKKNEEKSVKK